MNKQTTTTVSPGQAFDVESVRRDFPILDTRVGTKPLVYLDNAATTQKPQVVIDAIQRYYMIQNANIHRGVHYLSEQATDAYEKARATVARLLNARSENEVVFVRGATEAINLVASSWGGTNLGEGDEILITTMEHHANIVPWQLLCERTGAVLKVIPITDEGELVLEAFEKMLSNRTRLLSLVHLSNTLGTINPVKEMIATARKHDVKVLVDAAQSVPHMAVDVCDLDCDFLVFSGHKIYGPTGIGVLYGREELLNAMRPYQGGGDMINRVTFEKTTFKKTPGRFEAGTPHISGAIALAVAMEYVDGQRAAGFESYERHLLAYAEERLAAVDGLQIVGRARDKAGALSFVMEGAHPHDIGTVLDSSGIAIRAGHHCTQPLMNRLGIPATARASFALYNTRQEVDALAEALHRIHSLFN